jgi:SOS-response transcriptional repressor LexA
MRSGRNDWLRERIRDLGKTGQGLANALGVNKARVSEIIGGRRGVKAEEVTVIAMYVEMTEQDVLARLTGRPAAPMGQPLSGHPPGLTEQPLSPLSTPPMMRGSFIPRTAELPPPGGMLVDVPVFGTVVGGVDADFEMNGEVIDRVRRPPGLLNAKNAFALYVVGTSMSPRYDEGDLIFIHPGKPPVPGCDVVIELHAIDDFGRNKALLKTYRGKSPNRLLLSQLNPEGPLELQLSEVKQVLRVLRTNELLGI